mgnify:CR=1 FL=1
MELEEITIIITTFKSDKKINSCLDSISRRAKVLIVENSGNKELKDSIERKYTNVQCIISKDNLGYAKANNLGLRKVKTKYALVLNPDSILKSDALENFLKTTLTCKDFSLIGPTTNQGRKVEGKNDLIKVKNLKGFGIFFNMEKFQDNKFFDENYFLYFEEIDLCKNVTINNGKIYLDPKIKIFHEGGSSVDNAYSFEIEKNRNWHWMWSTFYYHKKYNGFFYGLLKVSTKFFSALIRVMLYSILFNQNKKKIYFQRLSGLFNSIIGKKSWYRPKIS